MTVPLGENSTSKSIAGLDYKTRQLARRPGVGESGPAWVRFSLSYAATIAAGTHEFDMTSASILKSSSGPFPDPDINGAGRIIIDAFWGEATVIDVVVEIGVGGAIQAGTHIVFLNQYPEPLGGSGGGVGYASALGTPYYLQDNFSTGGQGGNGLALHHNETGLQHFGSQPNTGSDTIGGLGTIGVNYKHNAAAAQYVRNVYVTMFALPYTMPFA